MTAACFSSVSPHCEIGAGKFEFHKNEKCTCSGTASAHSAERDEKGVQAAQDKNKKLEKRERLQKASSSGRLELSKLNQTLPVLCHSGRCKKLKTATTTCPLRTTAIRKESESRKRTHESAHKPSENERRHGARNPLARCDSTGRLVAFARSSSARPTRGAPGVGNSKRHLKALKKQVERENNQETTYH